MKYRKLEAKEYFKQHMKGFYGAAFTPFTRDYKIDEQGIRHNMRYWIDELHIPGVFLNGVVGEGFTQTIAERKRVFEIGVEEAKGDMMILPYCSDECMENSLELTKHAENIGADLAVFLTPRFYLGSMTDDAVFQYFKFIADRVNIAILLFNRAENGYLISPQLTYRLATEIPNFVATKGYIPQADIRMLRILCSDKIVVSDPIEDNWLISMTTHGQKVFVGSPDAFSLQSKKLKGLNEYTTLAMNGDITGALEAYKRLEPIRRAFQRAKVPGKSWAFYKYWAQCLGMAGGDGRVRMPNTELTKEEKQAIKDAVESTGLI